jgi:hypothetical protein
MEHNKIHYSQNNNNNTITYTLKAKMSVTEYKNSKY